MKQQNLLSDTRTFLYKETLYTAHVYDSWLIGRTPARGTISAFFGHKDLSGRGERNSNEAAILNVFTWTGAVGVVLYGLTFFLATNLAIAF